MEKHSDYSISIWHGESKTLYYVQHLPTGKWSTEDWTTVETFYTMDDAKAFIARRVGIEVKDV